MVRIPEIVGGVEATKEGWFETEKPREKSSVSIHS